MHRRNRPVGQSDEWAPRHQTTHAGLPQRNPLVVQELQDSRRQTRQQVRIPRPPQEQEVCVEDYRTDQRTVEGVDQVYWLAEGRHLLVSKTILAQTIYYALIVGYNVTHWKCLLRTHFYTFAHQIY